MNWTDLHYWRDGKQLVDDPNVIKNNVVGVTFIDGYPANLIRLLAVLAETGSIRAHVRRNPDNKYDSNACEVWVDESMIGHLDKETAAKVAPKLDSGSECEISIVSIGFANGNTSKPGASYHLKLT